VIAVRGARRYLGDRLIRTAAPHRCSTRLARQAGQAVAAATA
jgi:predicted oxidoreductase